ncbi:non-specific lipid-transfer protein 3 [Sesamum indicum]|uniref:Non-specific lipid-transfer protein 3 n=1 Tax=Sesamum indicum TaxID=4182 RepID=A0A6I9TBW1_SESIN|nr:non-specific lipid-transfer protein 3 [Sesamum indicum]
MAYFRLNPDILALVLIISSFFRTDAQISTPCTSSMITTFTPCLNYVTGSSGRGSSPTEDCCNSLKSLMNDGMDCACLIVTGNVPLSIPFINRNLAISLPRVCQTSVPVQCKASGDPLPPPGPVVLGPTPAPAPRSHSPKDSDPTADAAPPPAEISDIEPATPPDFSLGPSANPGIRPVVNPNSASNPSTSTLLPYLVLIFVGIMTFKFL